MIIQARFGSAQTGLGYQFYDASAALLGSRITAGITALPEAGSYIADATVPGTATGVYWNSTVSGATATEDLREALASAPTAAAIADAVWDEALSGHATAGTAGAQLTAAGAAGDPWATVIPAAYQDGTAGAALGRLNNTPADAPVVIIPDADDDATLCVVYLYTEDISNVQRAGITVTFTLETAPSKADRILEAAPRTITTDAEGFASISLQRTDAITPSGARYLVSSAALGIVNLPLELTGETYNLATLIS